MLLDRNASYRENYDKFAWHIPEFYNMAHMVCDRHADGANGTALIHDRGDGQPTHYSFRDIQRLANRLANLFIANGAARGDRVMILLGQDPHTAAAHIACWKAGMVSLPTSMLFGADALTYRLNDSGAVLAITDMENAPKLLEAQSNSNTLRKLFIIDGELRGAASLQMELERSSDQFENVLTRAEDPAFFNYSSGTTGQPKGVLAAHRSLIGHMPGIEMTYDHVAAIIETSAGLLPTGPGSLA